MRFSQKKLRLTLWVAQFSAAALILAAIFLCGSAWAADGKTSKSRKAAEEKILIDADKLVTNDQEKYAEFLGHVKATQGNFVITADALKIYYRGNLINRGKKSSDEDMLSKIVATGNVKITSEEYVAEAQKMQYDIKTQELVLSGKNSKVTSGKNSITGSQITLNRQTGRVNVEGGSRQRVKAVFYSKEKLVNPLQKKPAGGKEGKSP